MGASRGALRLAPWLLIAFLAGSLGALVFNIIAARTLQPASYSLLSSIVFVFGLSGVVSVGLTTAQSRAVAQGDAEQTSSAPARGTGGQRFGDVRMGFKVGGLVAAGVFLVSPLLGAALGAPIRYLLAAALAVPLVVASGVGYGRLYGSGRVRAAQAAIMVDNAVRVAIGAAVALLAYGTLGFEVAYAAGPGAALVLALILTRNLSIPPARSFSPELWNTVAALACLFAAMQLDIPLSRALFDPVTAGQYAAIATVAKALTGISLIGGQILIRRAVHEGNTAESRIPTAWRAAIYSGLVSLPLALALVFLGKPVLNVLYGELFVPSWPIVALVALAAIPWSICTAVLQVRLAQGSSKRLIWVLSLGVLGVGSSLVVGAWFGLAYFALASGLIGLVLAIVLTSNVLQGRAWFR